MFLLFTAFTLVLDIRPGREWYVVKYLLFEESITSLLLYVLAFAVTIVSVVALLTLPNPYLRFVSWLIFGVAFFVNSCYRLITGYEFMYNDWLLAKSNLSFSTQALQQFLSSIIISLFFSLGVVWLGLYLVRKKSVYAPSFMLWWIPMGFVLAYGEIGKSVGTVEQFPAMVRMPVILTHSFFNSLPSAEREPVVEASSRKKVPHIFLIVDESITGSALGLNNPTLQTTPFLVSHKDQLIDFGVTSSYTNYSAGSNLALTTGARMQELPDSLYDLLRQPTLYQYARNAGYKTFLIDAQMDGHRLQNFLSDRDSPFIDSVISIASIQKDKLRYELRDSLINVVLAGLASSDQPVFGYVVKFGAHWPYARTYPEKEAYFKPTLSRSSLIKDSIKTRNTYFNAIRWSVDTFWKNLINNLAEKDSTIILYTSDHGQDISRKGIQLSQASVYDVSPDEANVPLWIYANYPMSFRPVHRNDCHQQDIFPTLLGWMGYEKDFVLKRYGPSLLDSNYQATTPRTFLTGDIFNRATSARVKFE